MARRAAGLLAGLLLAAGSTAAQLRLVEVRVSGRAGVDSLARLGFEVAGVRLVDGELRAAIVTEPRTEGALLARGYAPTVMRPAAAAHDTYKVYRSFDKPLVGIRATLTAWAAADTIFHLDSVGASIEGRPILAVKIGESSDSPTRPNVLFMGTHHAREWVATEVAMKLARWIADSLPRPLLAQRDIWVIPVENPDGYQYTFTNDRLWRKNRRANAGGSFGVDPNRNYPGFWGYDNAGSSPDPFSEVYRGTGPASEPETQAIVAFHATHPPVVSLSYHTYSGLVLHPYGFASGLIAPDQPVFRALAGTDIQPAVLDSVPNSVLAFYHPGPGWNLYATNGEYTEWAYRTHGTIAYTPELTSGCCEIGNNNFYGFVFPDDSAMVERVFRDQLPFARSLIQSAADPRNATGVSGLVPRSNRFESLWPEAWVSADVGTVGVGPLSVRLATGPVVSRNALADSLRRGEYLDLFRSDLRLDTILAVRAAGFAPPLEAELLSLAGAEDRDLAAGWTGWVRTGDNVAGANSWLSNGAPGDTLTSPVVNLSGRTRVWLQFWQKHFGSTFSPAQHGVVQFSPDGGATWTDVWHVLGAGTEWYPTRVDLPQAAGAAGARVRFVALGFPWQVDAVALVSDSTAAFTAAPPVAALEVSENPVRGAQVVIAWPVGTNDARVAIYSFRGERLVSAAIAPPNDEYVWDLTVGGRPVSNGGYIVVVEVDGRRMQRRLFVAR